MVPISGRIDREPENLTLTLMYRIYYFSDESGQNEFIVISDQGEQAMRDEFCNETVGLIESLAIDGDATSMPCDRKLCK